MNRPGMPLARRFRRGGRIRERPGESKGLSLPRPSLSVPVDLAGSPDIGHAARHLDGEDEGDHAKALNYASFYKVENGQVIIKDEETGQLIAVKPKVIINAAGPWIDYINRDAGIKTKYIGGTKGSHLVIKNEELRKAVGVSEFFFENKDGRIVLCLPFHDKVIVGTSDLPIDNPDDAYCTPEEEEYFIELVSRVFPTIKITRDQIVFRFSGVRPLEYQEAKTTGQITRDHSIKEDTIEGMPLLSLVGGKWTSFRAFSEQVATKTLETLGKTRAKSTESLPIRGGENLPLTKEAKEAYVTNLVATFGLAEDYAKELLRRYGTYAVKIAAFIQENQGKTLTASTTFFAFPYKVGGLILIALLVMGFLIWKGRRRIKAAFQVLFGGK